VLLYFLVTLGFGFYKRSDKGINSFLFAGRKLTISALVATLVSTWYGGILEVGRFTYENGIVTWIIFGLFYYIAALLFVKYIAPKIIESGIFASALMSFKNEYYFSDSHDQKSVPYSLLNLTLGKSFGKTTATIWIRNAMDERYTTRGFYFGLIPPDYPDQLWKSYGDPRQIGITVDYTF